MRQWGNETTRLAYYHYSAIKKKFMTSSHFLRRTTEVVAQNIKGTIDFTTFSGGANVHSVPFTDDPGVSLKLGSIVNLTPTPGADGLLSIR